MIIAFSNQKGGVGKTTTVLNLGAYLAKRGKKVLLVDLDPQANLTSGIGYSSTPSQDKKLAETPKSNTIYDVLIGKTGIAEIFVSTQVENLFLVPSGIELAGAEIELVNMMSREQILKKRLHDIKEYYDFILIDCPPSLGILTINGLTAADQLAIPVQCEYFALEGLGQLMETYKMVRANLNQDLELMGVILTMYDSRTRLSKDTVKEVQKFFENKVFDTIIPRNVRLAESPSHGKPISLYAKSSEGAKAYDKLAKEFVKKQ